LPRYSYDNHQYPLGFNLTAQGIVLDPAKPSEGPASREDVNGGPHQQAGT